MERAKEQALYSRRDSLKIFSLSALSPFLPSLPTPRNFDETSEAFLPKALMSHDALTKQISDYAKRHDANFTHNFSRRMKFLNNLCIKENGCWIEPSHAYDDFYTRDAFWILAAQNNPEQTKNAISRLSNFASNEGQIPTFISKDASGNFNAIYNDDESNLLFILTNFLQHQKGVAVDRQSVSRAYQFMLNNNLVEGKYRTRGAAQSTDETAAYHYWADTLLCPPQSVIAYNQGLASATLVAMEKMGFAVDPSLKNKAQQAYRNIHAVDNTDVLTHMQNIEILDVSALTGEALSLYFLNRSILGAEKVKTTVDSLLEKTAATYENRHFLGLKTLVQTNGEYVTNESFLHSESTNSPGSYHNGGSWMLYDSLALYAAARHRHQQAAELLVERLVQEQAQLKLFSYEFVRTTEGNIGSSPDRAYYGWNTFVSKLLTPHVHG